MHDMQSQVTTSHRTGPLNKCRRLGIIVSPANIIGVTIDCPLYRDRIGSEPRPSERPENMPAFLL